MGWLGVIDNPEPRTNRQRMETHAQSVGLGGDGDEFAALRAVEEEFGVSLDYSDARDWSTVGDVYSALLLRLSPEEVGQPNVWDRFAIAICLETGISPLSIRLESGLIAESGMWVHVVNVSALVWIAAAASMIALVVWALI